MRLFSPTLFLALIHVLFAGFAFAQTAEEKFVSKARNAILMDARSGRIYFEQDADTAVPPASMSKLMTQAVVFDLLKKGDLKSDRLFTVSEAAWRGGGAPSGGSTMYAALKSEISVADLLKASIIQSANDACLILAEGIDGSEQSFVVRMNQFAKELGLKNSTFANATGLPDPNHKMSVRDIALLARHIILNHSDQFPTYSERSFTWNKIQQPNRNPLLADYKGADGMKTGFTTEAGYGLVGTVERDGRRIIMVVAGLATAAERKTESQRLLDWGFSQFRAVEVYSEGDKVGRARVWGGASNWVDLVTAQSFQVALTKEERQTAEVKLTYLSPLMAPVAEGTVVGSVKIYVENKVVVELPVRTASSVKPITSMWEKAWDSVLILVFGG
jgi:serine-type D-Ala-D-Ala carboxypeptidase (penicillin-binding protein 5/6)